MGHGLAVYGTAIALAALSPLTGVGLIVDAYDYWISFDAFMLAFAPVAAYVLLASWNAGPRARDANAVYGTAAALAATSPLTGLGLGLDDLQYWLAYDVFLMVFLPAAAYVMMAAWRRAGRAAAPDPAA